MDNSTVGYEIIEMSNCQSGRRKRNIIKTSYRTVLEIMMVTYDDIVEPEVFQYS